jgi:hypothetical protein
MFLHKQMIWFKDLENREGKDVQAALAGWGVQEEGGMWGGGGHEEEVGMWGGV